MDNSASSRSHLQQQSALLRSEIKQWEHEFKQTHAGAKPTRDHIKQNPDIALKYRQYQQVRDRLEGPDPDPSPGAGAGPSPPSRKRTAAAAVAASSLATPSKRPRHAITPTRRNPGPTAEDDSPIVTPAVSRTLFSPAPPTSVGPTPQRDGRVLGLFDLLSSGGSTTAAAAASAPAIETPSRRKMRPVAQGTPSRGGRGPEDDGDETPRTGRRRLLLRTPMSASRRQMLDAFVTTTPLRKGDENAGGARTPSSVGGVSKLQFDTPAFLRRAPLPKIDENGDAYADLAPLRLPRKPFARGLSAIVASLRKVEEEALDDDLDALREMEAESMGIPRTKPAVAPDNDAGENRLAMRKEAAAAEERRDMMAKDSQSLLGGFDDEDLHDGPAEVQRGRDGQPLRVYKKKGQKRTTRLFKMKPTRSKRPAAEEGGDGGDSDPEEAADVVPETQPRDMAGPHAEGDTETADVGSEAEFNAGSDDEDEDEDDEEEAADRARRKKAGAKKDKPRKEDQKGAEEAKKTKTKKNKKKGGDREGGDKKDSEGTVKKVARKVNEMAHTNFRRLKLRNSGAKGGPGYNSRFRRRK